MKNKYLKFTLKFVFIFALLISCKKKKTPPELTLLGDAVVDLCLGDSYVDPGIQSIDAYDTDISGLVDISSNLDSGTVGSYTITYTSTDENDNVSIAERTINVGICISSIVSSYSVSSGCNIDPPIGNPINLISENQSILEGNTPNEFIIDDFNIFISQITGTIDGSTLTIPENEYQVLVLDVTISGTGTINDTGDEIVINYNYDAGPAGSGSCTATYTK